MLSYLINVITYLKNQGLFGPHCIYCIYFFRAHFSQANRFATSHERHLKRHLSKHSDSTVHLTGKPQILISSWSKRAGSSFILDFMLSHKTVVPFFHPNFCFVLLILHSTGDLFWPRHYGFVWPQLPSLDSQWSSQLRAWWPLIGRNKAPPFLLLLFFMIVSCKYPPKDRFGRGLF